MVTRVLPGLTPRVLSLPLCFLMAALAACGDDSDTDDTGSDVTGDTGAADSGDAADVETPDADGSGEADADALTPPDGGDADVVLPEPGGPLFADGCVAPGAVRAGRISNPEVRMEGANALGGEGDWLLMNDQAAFIIQDVENVKTYWYYGGGPIDAVAVENCTQMGPEQYDEMGFLLGLPNIGSFTDSTLRGFRGDSVELISDGTDGKARIRVTGEDDYFWLIELELVKQGFSADSPRAMSEPMGVEVVIDYVLRPGSSVLEMEVTIRNKLDTPNRVITGMVQFFADGTRSFYHADDRLEIAGFGADVNIPWLVNTSENGSRAIGIENWSIATTNIAGVDAIIDVNTFLSPNQLAPAGRSGDSITTRMFFAVGGSDGHSAVDALQRILPEPVLGRAVTPTPFAGRVVDEAGAPVAGARVAVEARGSNGVFTPIDEFISLEDGTFAGDIPALAGNSRYRLSVRSQGRPEPAPVEFAPGTSDFTVTVGDGGTVNYSVVDTEGTVTPAKIVLWRENRMAEVIFTDGSAGTRVVPPGNYEVDITRGFEYGVVRENIIVEPGGSVDLNIVIERLLNTDGYLSFDGHVHAGPSPDSPILVPDRILSLAVEGVEVAVSTDHEILRDWQPGLEESGLEAWVNTVLGEEVTPPLPEHTNAYPFVADPNSVRGNPPDWRGLDITELHETIRERGASIVALNHPRLGCNYMCLIGYDPVLGDATLEDPTLLGFEPDAQLWSWNFDTVEYQNGNRGVFLNPDSPQDTGPFEDWQSFIHHGHSVTATGVTDTHGADAEGSPRNFFLAPTDSPIEFTDEMLVSAMQDGRSVVSTGAFAHVTMNDGARLGDTVTDTDGTVTLDIRIEAIPDIDVTTFTVFANCDEVATIETTSPDGVIKYEGTVEVPVDADANIVVLGFGQELLPRNLPQFDPTGVPRFTTNPIYVDFDGNGTFDAPGGKTCEYDLEPERKTRVLAPVRTAFLLERLEAWEWWRISALPEEFFHNGPCVCGTHDDHDH